MATAGSILGETFAGVRARLPAVAVWSAIYFAATFLGGFVTRPMMQAQMATMAAARVGAISPLSAMGGFFGALLLLWLVLMLVFVVLFAAAMRAALFPGGDRAFYLRLGGDEARLIGLSLLLLLVFFLLYIVLVIVGVIVGGAVAAATGLTATSGGANGGGMAAAVAGLGFFFVLLVLLLLAVMIFFGVRLSLAMPLTMLRKRIVLVDSWYVTRGHFWKLFGAYFLLGVLMAFAILVIAGVFGGSTFIAGMRAGADPAAAQRIIAEQNASVGGPLGIVGSIVMALVGGLWLALQGGVVAAATRQLLPSEENIFA